MTKEFKVGDLIPLGKVTLRVEKYLDDSGTQHAHACSNCFFNDSVSCDYSDILVGSCVACDREDNQSVIFVEVKE